MVCERPPRRFAPPFLFQEGSFRNSPVSIKNCVPGAYYGYSSLKHVVCPARNAASVSIEPSDARGGGCPCRTAGCPASWTQEFGCSHPATGSPGHRQAGARLI